MNQKKLPIVILDIDETLLSTNPNLSTIDDFCLKMKKEDINKYNAIIDKIYHIEIEPSEEYSSITLNGVFRPHLQEFLNFCKEHFQIVAIWSAGTKEYVESVIKLFGDKFLFKPHFYMTKNDLTYIDDNFYKSLNKIYEEKKYLSKIINSNNTIIIDDNENTFKLNVGNAIHIPQFLPDITYDSLTKDENSLLKVMEFLKSDKVMNCQNICEIDKNIF